MKYGIGFFLLFIIKLASAQTPIKQDAAIKQMVDEVSAKNIEAIIRKLVSFKTRHTLSDTTVSYTHLDVYKRQRNMRIRKPRPGTGRHRQTNKTIAR